MAYLGNTPTQQGFTPAIDYFSGNASTTAFTLSRPVASVAQVQAVIENVPQNPGDAFTVSGNTITFTSAPPSGTNNIYVYYTSPITTVVQPGQGTVGTAQLVSGLTVNFADGSASAPSITNDGDTNTGIFFPAADTIAFAEGGTEIARFDSSGNFGIGTSSPNDVLEIAGANAFIRVNRTGNDPGITLRYNNSTTLRGDIGVTSGGDLYFTAGGSTERGRFTSAGLFQFNSGYGSVATAYGCRAWVNWNGTGSSSSIRGSGNVSSVTDNGTGDYTINFTTALVDTNYTANFSISSDDNGTFGNNGGTNTGVFSNFSSNVLVAPTTSAVRVGTSWTGAGRPNPTYCCVVVFR